MLIYELLTGTTPFDSKRLRSAAYGEIQRIIREEEPQKPSTRLSTLKDTLASVAAHRHTDPGRLAVQVKGDLDWIVMKCLEKDRTRRYETASGLAADVLRHLSGDAVLAAPPSTAYKVRKFVLRHSVGVAAGTAIAATLVFGMVGTTLGFLDARAHRAQAEAARSAEAARAEGERLANLRAQKRLGQIEKANRLLASIFETLNPEEVAESGVPLQAMLSDRIAKAAEQLEGESIGDPLLVASLQATLGASLTGMSQGDKAITLLTKALATQESGLGADHPETLNTKSGLADAYLAAGRPEVAIPLGEEVLGVMRERLGPEHAEAMLRTMGNLAHAYRNAGRLDLALPLFEETFERRKALLGADHPDTLNGMASLAATYWSLQRLDKSIPLFEDALQRQQASVGKLHPQTLATMQCLGVNYIDAGRTAEGVSVLEEALSRCRVSLGPNHLLSLRTMQSLGQGYRACGKLELAVALLEEAVKLMPAAIGSDHPDTLAAMSHLGAAYWDSKQLDKSIPMFEEQLKLAESRLGPNHHITLLAKANLGVSYLDGGQLAKATPLLKVAYEGATHDPSLRMFGIALVRAYAKAGDNQRAAPVIRNILNDARSSHPSDNLEYSNTLYGIASSLLGLQLWSEAEPLLEQTHEMTRRLYPDGHPLVVDTLTSLANVRKSLGRLAEAGTLYEQALEMSRRLYPGDHQTVAGCLTNVAIAREQTGRAREAEPLYVQATEMYQRLHPDDHVDVATSLGNLASVRESLGRFEDAEPLHVQSLEMRRRLFPGDHPDVAQSLSRLATVRLILGRAAEAEPLADQALEMSRRLYPGDHANVVRCLIDLGLARSKLGRHEDAALLFREALAIIGQLGDTDSRQTTQVLYGLADCLWRLDQPEEAEKLAAEAVDLCRAHSDWELWRHLRALEVLTKIHESAGRFAEAEPLRRESLTLWERRHSPDSANYRLVVQQRALLGLALLGHAEAMAGEDRAGALSRLREAEALIVESAEWMTAGLDRTNPRMPLDQKKERAREADERVVRLYETWNRVEPGKGYEEKAQDWRKRIEDGR